MNSLWEGHKEVESTNPACGASSLHLKTRDTCHQETAQAGEKESASLSILLVPGRTLLETLHILSLILQKPGE